MIHVHRTASVAPGRMAQAQAHALEVSQYVKQRHGVTVSVSFPVGGNPNRVRWSLEMASLAAYEAWTAQTRADADYWAVLAKGSDLYIAGSIFDEIWRSA